MSLRQKQVLWLSLLSAFFALFQNCSPVGVPLSGMPQTLKSSGLFNPTQMGGDGYDGKITYINRTQDGPCADGSSVKAKISMDGQVGNLVRQNCAEISPISLTREEMALMPHNEFNAVVGRNVFDLLTQETDPTFGDSVSSKFLCRGKYENKNNAQMQVADVIVKYKQDGKQVHSAKVIMAVYSPEGKLLETLNSGEIEVRGIETGVEGRLKYVTPYVGRHMITLWIDKKGDDRKTGKLSFIDLPFPGKQNESGYNFRDHERVIQDLECFSQ